MAEGLTDRQQAQLKQLQERDALPEGVRLADHFPAVHPACQEPAAKFFFCFSKHGEQVNAVDPGAGRRGLKACLEEMEAYDKCMAKVLKK